MASTVEKIGQRVRAVVAKRTVAKRAVAKRAVAKREEPRRVRASQVSGGHNNPGGKVVLKVGVGTIGVLRLAHRRRALRRPKRDATSVATNRARRPKRGAKIGVLKIAPPSPSHHVLRRSRRKRPLSKAQR